MAIYASVLDPLSASGRRARIRVVARAEIITDASALIADALCVFLKCKSFHWHGLGPANPRHGSMFERHALGLLTIVDILARRVNALGGQPLRSAAEISVAQRIQDSGAEFLHFREMCAEARLDYATLTANAQSLRIKSLEQADRETTFVMDEWICETRASERELLDALRVQIHP